MVISSRTPEGDPNRCDVCGNDLRIEPSTVPTRDAPCPHCGQFLWFEVRKPPKTSYEGFILRAGRKRLGPIPVNLVKPLFAAIAKLARQERLPRREEMIRMVNDSKNWATVVKTFERLTSYGPRSWLSRAGRLVRKVKQLFAPSP
jgi:hypothetical protein